MATPTVRRPPPVTYEDYRRMPEHERALEGPPDVVVEIVSPSSSDRDTYIKRRIYEDFGIPEYWVVDPDVGQMTVHRLDQGSYGIRANYDRASTLECPEFPTLQVPLLDVFR